MLRRATEALVRARLGAHPAVALYGARQVGKTTLARAIGGHYFDVEQDADRLRLDLAFAELARGEERVILDEAQAWPALFPRLRAAIDADRARRDRFLILGSVAPSLMREVSESLAGRLSLVELLPLTLVELAGAVEVDELWLRGGYPGGARLYPSWHKDYVQLLTARDLPNWGLPTRPAETERLLRMVSALHGQLWNASQVGQSLGLTHPTVNKYLDHLESAFLVRRLRPWHANLGKRLTKTPRIYWRDSGLLHALQLVRDMQDLLGRPWVGASFEGFVIEQAIGALVATGASFEPWFFRTSDGFELDLLLDLGEERWAVEVKLTSSPSTADLARLTKAADMVGATRRFLVSRTTEKVTTGATWSCGVEELVRALAARGRA